MTQEIISGVKTFFLPTKNKLLLSGVYFILFLIWIGVTVDLGLVIPSFLVVFIYPLKGFELLVQQLPFQLQFSTPILGILNAYLMSCFIIFLFGEVVQIFFHLKTRKAPKTFLLLLFLVFLSSVTRIFFHNLHPVDRQWGLFGLSLLYFPLLLICLILLSWNARMRLVTISSSVYLLVLLVLSSVAIAISRSPGYFDRINIGMLALSTILPAASLFLAFTVGREYKVIGVAAFWFGLLNFINDSAFPVYFYDQFPHIVKLIVSAITYPQVYTSVLLVVILFRVWNASFSAHEDEGVVK